MKEIDKIKEAADKILNSKTSLRKKKPTRRAKASQTKKLFENLVKELEIIIARENILSMEFGLDTSNHNNPFFYILDKLIEANYGKNISELLYFYLHERLNPDMSLNPAEDPIHGKIILKNFNDLWDAMIKINPNISKEK